MRYIDIPDETRLNINKVLEDEYKCARISYSGDCAVFAIPRENVPETYEAILGFGLEVVSDVFFPLGSDKPAEHLRHDGTHTPYPGYLGYWRYLHVRPKGCRP